MYIIDVFIEVVLFSKLVVLESNCQTLSQNLQERRAIHVWGTTYQMQLFLLVCFTTRCCMVISGKTVLGTPQGKRWKQHSSTFPDVVWDTICPLVVVCGAVSPDVVVCVAVCPDVVVCGAVCPVLVVCVTVCPVVVVCVTVCPVVVVCVTVCPVVVDCVTVCPLLVICGAVCPIVVFQKICMYV